MADTQLILHVKGTEETTSLPKPAVRAGIKEGQIKYSQLIWSPIHNAWKQVREMPHLWPSQKIAPAPPVRPASRSSEGVPVVTASPIPSASLPRVAASTTLSGMVPRVAGVATPSGTVPRVAAAATPPGTVPRVAVAATPSASVPRVAPKPAVKAQAPPKTVPHIQSEPVEEEIVPVRVVPDEPEADNVFKFLKWIVVGGGGLVALAAVMNYVLINQPLVSNLGKTPYAAVTVYAHLGALVQPGMLVIHIRHSPTLTAENFPGFLVALARSTPPKPVGDEYFDRVSLSPGWKGSYSFSGIAWSQLARTNGANDLQKERDLILDQIGDASGQPLAGPDAAADQREAVWTQFVATFAP
jgi:hypothetical protein